MRATLHDWQEPYIDQLRDAMAFNDRVLFQAPTGFGKTHCFTNMFQRTHELSREAWVMFHLKLIGMQVAKRFNTYGIPFSWIASGEPEGDNPIKLVMAHTAVNRLDHQRIPHWICEDECHHATASTWGKIRDWAQGAQILGCTATPERADGKPLAMAFDTMVHGPQKKFLIEVGQLVPPITFAPPNALDLTGVKRGANGDLDAAETSLRLEKAEITGDLIEHYKRLCPGAKTIVFDIRIEDAHETAAAFRAAGFAFKAIDSKMTEQEREILFREFEQGTIIGLVNVSLFLEGVDVPNIECVIWRRPTESEPVWQQGNGRGLRSAPGKTCVWILDHVGNTYRHGLPEMDRWWSLQGTPKSKRAETGGGGGTIRCEACHRVFPVGFPICPECGTAVKVKEREIITVDGQLVLVTDERKVQELMIRERQKRVVSENLYKCKKRQDFVDLALSVGRDESFGEYLFQRYLRVTKKKGVTL